MNRWLLGCVALAFSLIPALAQPQNLNATSELKLGIVAYENGKYEGAIDHLERALALDPTIPNGHLHLARAYFDAYVESPECGEEACAANERVGVRGVQEFQKVLEKDPHNLEALKALAWRDFTKRRFDEATGYYRAALDFAPNDIELLYPLAVLEWEESYQPRQQKRLEFRIKPTEPFIHSPACSEIRSQNMPRVKESITLLQRVIGLVKSYDAEEYLSILYRDRADIQCDDQALTTKT